MLNCKEPGQHGVAQYCVPAVLYIAQDEWLVQGMKYIMILLSVAVSRLGPLVYTPVWGPHARTKKHARTHARTHARAHSGTTPLQELHIKWD